MGKCHLCQGRLEPRRIEHVGRWGNAGPWVLIRDVPAEVCTQCGEAYFDSDVANAITRVLKEAAEDPVAHAEVQVMVVKELPSAMSGKL